MKKILSIFLIGVLCFCLVGCGNKSTKQNETTEGNVSEPVDYVASWNKFYTAYTNTNSEMGEFLTGSSLKYNPNTYYTYTQFFYDVGSVYLSLADVLFNGNESAVRTRFGLYKEYTDITYTANGDTETVTGINKNGVKETYTVQYDVVSQTAELKIETDTTKVVISLSIQDDGTYAQSLYTSDGKGSENFLEVYYKDNDFKLAWTDADTTYTSLYKNSARVKEDNFAKNGRFLIDIADAKIVTQSLTGTIKTDAYKL